MVEPKTDTENPDVVDVRGEGQVVPGGGVESAAGLGPILTPDQIRKAKEALERKAREEADRLKAIIARKRITRYLVLGGLAYLYFTRNDR